MPSKNVRLIKIWSIAHQHLRKLSDATRELGYYKSAVTIASELILSTPIPNGDNNNSGFPAPLPPVDVPPSNPGGSGGSAPVAGSD